MGDVPRSPRGSRAGTLPCADVRLSSSCTSPQVERRDPLGVGLRPGCGDCRVAGKTARDKPPVARPAARRYAQGIRPHFYTVRRGRRKRAPRYSEVTDFAPSPVLARCWLKYGSPSTGLRTSLSHGGDGYRSATLLLWVLLGPVLKHGPRSLTCTRVIGTCRET